MNLKLFGLKNIIWLSLFLIGIVRTEEIKSLSITRAYSDNNKFFLEIIPPGCGDNNSYSCAGNFYTIDSLNNPQLLWSRQLMNSIAPIVVLVSNDGNSVVTLDDWGNMGYGPNVIVIYGQEGKLIEDFPLDNFALFDEVPKMATSDSMRYWRGAYWINNQNNTFIVDVITNGKMPGDKKALFRRVIFALNNGNLNVEKLSNGDTLSPDINAIVPVDVPAKPSGRINVEYPELARTKGHEGVVYVKMLVEIDGTVLKAVIIKSSGYPELDNAAVDMAKRLTFTPANRDNKPVRVWVTTPIRFELQ